MDSIQEEHLGMTIISPEKIQTYKKRSETTDFKQWVCRIAGTCEKFGFKREFVKSKIAIQDDKFLSVKFMLEAGNLYEYKNLYVGLDQYVSGFIAVLDENNIMSLDKKNVRELLGMPTKNWSRTKGKPTFFLEEKKVDDDAYVSDDVPF